MAVTHPIATQNAATNAVLALIGASGRLVYRTTGNVGAPGTPVATLILSATGFAAAVDGISEANPITSDSNATGNGQPVATATLQTSGGTVVVHCQVAASGSDIDMTNGLLINPGDTVACTFLSYRALIA